MSIQERGRLGAQVRVRGSTLLLKGLLWVRTLLGSLLKETRMSWLVKPLRAAVAQVIASFLSQL